MAIVVPFQSASIASNTYLPSMSVFVSAVSPFALVNTTRASATGPLVLQSRTNPVNSLPLGAFVIRYVSIQHPSPLSEPTTAFANKADFSDAKKYISSREELKGCPGLTGSLHCVAPPLAVNRSYPPMPNLPLVANTSVLLL